MTTLAKVVHLLISVAAVGVLSKDVMAQSRKGPRYFDRPVDSEMIFLTGGTGGNCAWCRWIVAEGAITADTPRKFEEFVKKEGRSLPPTVHIHSGGGNLLGAIKLGELIRQRNLNTIVAKTVGNPYEEIPTHIDDRGDPRADAICASACVFAFVGGVQRYAVQEHYRTRIDTQGRIGRLGVHQFFSKDAILDFEKKAFSALDRSGDQIMTGILLEYSTRMGVSSELVSMMMLVRPQNILWLNDDQLRSTSVENSEGRADARIAMLGEVSAAVEVRFKTDTASVIAHFFCDKRKALMMNVEIQARYETTTEELNSWGLYDSIALKVGTTEHQMQKRKLAVERRKGESKIKILYQVGDVGNSQLYSLRKFDFVPGPHARGRYAAEAAWGLSFTLPEGFRGMKILPRTCLLND